MKKPKLSAMPPLRPQGERPVCTHPIPGWAPEPAYGGITVLTACVWCNTDEVRRWRDVGERVYGQPSAVLPQHGGRMTMRWYEPMTSG